MALLGTKSSWSPTSPQPTKKSVMVGQKKKHEIMPPTQNYFEYLQIQPGSGFFRGLVECKYPIGSISLNIPAMLINLGVTVLLRTSMIFEKASLRGAKKNKHTITDKNGKLKVTENVKMDKFVRRLEKRADKLYKDQPLMYIQEINDKKPWQETEVII